MADSDKTTNAPATKYATEITSDFVKFGTEAESQVWHEANAPKLATFVEQIEGVLLEVGSQVMQGKPVGRYTLEREDGSNVEFMGTVMLDNKMKLVEIGADIQITLTGSEKSTTAGHSPTKQFTVFQAE